MERKAINSDTVMRWVNGDYDRLYKQVEAGKETVAYVDYTFKGYNHNTLVRDIARIRNINWEFGARGIAYSRYFDGKPSLEHFIHECERLNVEWLEELPGLSQGQNGQCICRPRAIGQTEPCPVHNQPIPKAKSEFPKFVKIIKADLWYKAFEGSIATVVDEDEERYYTHPDLTTWLWKCDCQIVDNPNREQPLIKNTNMKNTAFTREQVIGLLDELLQRPDILIDAVQNENTDHSAKSLIELAESYYPIKVEAEKEYPKREDNTRYTYYRVDLKNIGEDWDYTICESHEEISALLEYLDIHLDDDSDDGGDPRGILISGVGMTPLEYRTWCKENYPDKYFADGMDKLDEKE